MSIALSIGISLAALGFLFSLFWIVAFKRNYRFSVPALAYHHIEAEKGFPATKITTRQFTSQVNALRQCNYRALSPEDFIKANGKESDRAVLITFDDSYASVFNHALPVLKANAFTATLFIITDYIGKPNQWDVSFRGSSHMNEDQIRHAVASGFSIGSHTKSHRDLTRLSGKALKEELQGSKCFLEDKFGIRVNYLAYPFGRYNKRVKAAARQSGYQGAFTISRPLFQFRFDPFSIPVSGIYAVDGMRNFMAKVERNGYVWIEDVKDKIINRFASGTALVKGSRTR
jgi:peptidoglycan/xylan/chitin deacetylase (PgdA/CDA1 family)